MTLPPGQRTLDGFPRFGAHFGQPPPSVPADPTIVVDGAVGSPITVALAELASLPRVERVAALHCVAGWSATGLRWEGVAMSTFYALCVEPALERGAAVTHMVFEGLDGYRAIVTVDDALSDDAMLADHLAGRPLDGDHGAPLRLVSPSQYGFMSVKHLCRIEVHTSTPAARYHPNPLIQFGLQMVKPHPRARVWQEERHRYLPAWLVRPLYRQLIPAIRRVSPARG